MLARQTKLSSKTADGETFTTCWLEVDKRVKLGSVITIKADPSIWWTVISMSEPMEMKDIHTDWDVGGLEDTRKKQLE